MSKNFALIGAAGYVAPRHMKAIKETGNNLVAAVDKTDSVGILDRYFPKASFFTEFERFDRHIEKLRRNNIATDYISICSPNYLHDAHIRFALRGGANAICEKPLVLNPWNLDALEVFEKESGKEVSTILQLRLHPSIQDLKRRVSRENGSKKHDVDLTYITSRGNWYFASWKGNEEKSGGIATNIGIHFFDMLGDIFGELENNVVHLNRHDRAAGFLEFTNARVRWFLSINKNDIHEDKRGKRTYRSLVLDGEEIEFSHGFEDLHTISYKKIMHGDGFGISDCRKALELVYDIRNQNTAPLINDYHPLAKIAPSRHPFKK